ncbi:hypothetical protein BU26DRAFT_524408 [Trematosphaeria pertusa]|uniref:Uncharacterized protein n=1 Tax=Trematosphaeria pertusa TaxID=390896 RepID=A0A6A6HW09_9PLEO|nr:uncharacterized protein BU26DRAFT_524408 [Trematosphaeria pertusa]KAF2242221.1 hypothetical protein BU26DRAFT_524408 [Trematosphaeria pertusa]
MSSTSSSDADSLYGLPASLLTKRKRMYNERPDDTGKKMRAGGINEPLEVDGNTAQQEVLEDADDEASQSSGNETSRSLDKKTAAPSGVEKEGTTTRAPAKRKRNIGEQSDGPNKTNRTDEIGKPKRQGRDDRPPDSADAQLASIIFHFDKADVDPDGKFDSLVDLLQTTTLNEPPSLFAKYNHWILAHPCDLLNRALPDDPATVDELSRFMCDEIVRMYADPLRASKFKPPLPPTCHPCFPFWMEEHPANDVIRKMWPDVRYREDALKKKRTDSPMQGQKDSIYDARGSPISPNPLAEHPDFNGPGYRVEDMGIAWHLLPDLYAGRIVALKRACKP